jgi:signal transduction histidine kinase
MRFYGKDNGNGTSFGSRQLNGHDETKILHVDNHVIQEALLSLALAMNASHTLEEILDQLHKVLCDFLPFDRMCLACVSDDRSEVRSVWARSTGHRLLLDVDYAMPLEGSSLEYILNSGLPRVIDDLPSYYAMRPGSEPTRMLIEAGMNASLCLPLAIGNEAIGFLFFSSRHRMAYQKQHVAMMERLAPHICQAIRRGRVLQRMNQLGRFRERLLTLIAHDLRTPLTIVRGYCGLLTNYGNDASIAETKLLVERIRAKCEYMQAMIEDMVDFGMSTESMQLMMAEINLPLFLQEMCHAGKLMAAGKRLEFNLAVDPHVKSVSADPMRMEQVIHSLIGIAIKASPDCAHVDISAKRSGRHVDIAVSHKGMALESDELNSVLADTWPCEYTLSASGNSNVLGLSVARSIAEAHGGTLGIEVFDGRESSYTLSIPRKGNSRRKFSRPHSYSRR